MLVKEQPVLSEPEAKPPERKPRRLVPDFSEQAKGFLESHIAAAFQGPVAPTEERVPDHATADPLRVASVLQAQREEGNFYVQQVIATYEKKHPELPGPSQPGKTLAVSVAEQQEHLEPASTGQGGAKAAPEGAAAERKAAVPKWTMVQAVTVPSSVAKPVILDKATAAYDKAHPVVPTLQKAGVTGTLKKSAASGPAAIAKAESAVVPSGPLKPDTKTAVLPSAVAPQTAVDLIAKPQKQDATGKAVMPGGKATPEQKLHPNPAKEETKSETISIDAQAGKSEIVAVTKPSKQSVEGGGASPSAAIQKWSANVAGAAQRTLTAPDLKVAEQAPDRIKSAADALLQQQQAKQPDYLAQANKSLPPTPKIEKPQEEPTDPIEKQSRDVIASAGTSRLTDQSLPPLESSPGYTKDDKKIPPRMPSFTPPVPAMDIGPETQPSEKSGADQVKTDTTRKDEAQKKIDQPATAAQAASPQQLTLKDKGPAPKPMVPESMKSDISGALKNVFSESNKAAEVVKTQAESAAFPGGVLKEVEPKLAADHLAAEKQDIEKEVYQIAGVAGVARDVVDSSAAKAVKDSQKQGEQNADNLDRAAAETKQKAESQGQGQLTAIKTAGSSVKDSVEKKKQAAAEAAGDNKAIEEREKKLTEQLRKDAAIVRAQFSKALEKRKSELDAAAATFAAAYRRTAKQEADEIKALYKDDDEKGRVASRPSLDWGDKEVKTIQEKVPLLKRDSGKETDSFKANLNKQELAAIDMVHTWANGHVSTWRSFWRHIADLFSGWANDAKATTEAWEEVRDQETTKQMVDDLNLIAKLKDLAAKGDMTEFQKAVAGLNGDQQALMLLFFASGPDSVVTLTTALVSRIEAQRIPKLTEALRTEALDLDWEKLDDLGRAQDPGFSATALAIQVNGAIAGIGTNREKLFGAIGQRTPVQMAALKKRYKILYPMHPDMEAEIDDDLSGDDAKRAKAALASDQTGEDVFALHDAIDSVNTDEAAIMKILRNKTPEEREAIFEKYKQEYNIDLKDHLHQELSGDDRDRADALLEGNTTKADAIAVQQSMHYHWYGGSEITELDAMYSQIRQEVEADAKTKNMTTAEVEAEVKRRGQAVQGEWEAKYSGGKPGSMTAAFKDNFHLAEQNLALGLSENDRTAQDAARIAMESQSTYTKDEKVLQILSAQRERADKEVHRDMAVHFKEQAAKEKWSPDVAKKKWEEMSAQADKEIDARAEQNLASLETAVDKDYSYLKSVYGTYDYDSDTFSPAKESALTLVVNNEMSGRQQEMAKLIREKGKGGKLSPEDEIYYSIEGLGHDVDHLKHALMDENGHPKWTKAQLDDMAKNYKGGKDKMLADIRGEIITGRDGFDINRAIKGKPETPEEIREYINAKTSYELGGSGGIGFLFAPDESLALAITSQESDRVYNEYLEAKKDDKNPAKAEALLKRYERWSTYTDDAVQGTREAVDAITDHAAMVAAIVVGVVVAVATAGTAAPAVVAALSAGAAALTSITVKAAMKGNAYSLEELGTDAAIGAVDVAAAALTAGIGSALLRTNILSRLSEQQLGTRLLRQGVAHGVGGMVAGVPAGVAGLALNDQTWKSDDVLKTFMLGTLKTAGTGFAFGSAFGMLHGIKAPPPEAHVTGKPSPKVDVHDVPATKPKPDLAATAKATVEAHPSNVEAQLKPIVNADEHPQTPGSPEDQIAKGVAKVKAISDPATPEAEADQAIKDLGAAAEKGKVSAKPPDAGGKPGGPETKPTLPGEKTTVVPGEEGKAPPAAEVQKEMKTPSAGEGKTPKAPVEKATALAEPGEKAVTEEGKTKGAGTEEKAGEPPVEKREPVKAGEPSADELRAARKERAELEASKDSAEKGKAAAEKATSAKAQEVSDKESEIADLESEREENAKRTPRTRDVERDAADLERKLKRARIELDAKRAEYEAKVREQDAITKYFDGKLKSIQERLGEIQAIEDQFKSSKPWREIDIKDPTTTEAQKGIYGELETALKMHEAGLKPMGDNLDPNNVVLPEDVPKAIEQRQGVQDIDHLYESPERAKWNTYAVDSKCTGTPLDGDPTGHGMLKETNNGWQLSDKWLIGNARKSGLQGAELEQFIKDVQTGKVRRIYSFTDPKNGTRIYEVERVGDTDVKIGKEITDEFKKKP